MFKPSSPSVPMTTPSTKTSMNLVGSMKTGKPRSTIVSRNLPAGMLSKPGGNPTSLVAPASTRDPRMPATPERGGAAPGGRGIGAGAKMGNVMPTAPAKLGGSGKFKYRQNYGASQFTPSRERTT